MHPPPIIGITAGNDPNNEAFYILRWDYIRSVEAAGGLPVILAPGGAAEHPGLFDRIHGLIISGGSDIDPARYGQEPHPALRRISTQRDEFELTVTRSAIARGTPILGVCRGAQVLNVALGGTLVQDIPSLVGTSLVHYDAALPRHALVHEVSIVPGSLLRRILPLERVEVNSLHHQAPDQLGEGLVPVAFSDDGVVEAIELPGDKFVLGIQWHPEAFWAYGAPFAPLFEALVGAARKRELELLEQLSPIEADSASA
jgi:putative glutamine amidotransferase